MTNSQPPKKPSSKQLRYAGALAERKGTSFEYPKTAADASRVIKQLLALPDSSRAERFHERRAVRMDLRKHSGGATRVRAGEVSGYGASAQWGGAP